MATPDFNLVPGALNLNGVVGDDFSVLFDFNVDLSGYSFEAKVLLDNNPYGRYQPITITNTNLPLGRITLSLSDAQTRIVGPISKKKWFISWTQGGDIRTVLSGGFTLNQPWAVTDYSPTTADQTIVIQTPTISVDVIGGVGGAVLWGDIQGDIEDQTDLIDYINNYTEGLSRNQQAWVEINGSDITGEINNPKAPFLTIAGALAEISSGGTINIGIGSFESPLYAQSKDYVSFIGFQRPQLNSGKTALLEGSGTILTGTWNLGDAATGITIQNLGVDVGSDWCAEFNSGVQADGISVDDTAALGGVVGFQCSNVIVLMKPGGGLGHGLSLQDVTRGNLDNIEVWYGVHGIAFKGQYSNLSNLNLNGCEGEGLILKNGSATLKCEYVNVCNVAYSAEGHPGAAIILNAVDSTTGPLTQINISNVVSLGAVAVLMNPATAFGVRDINLSNITAEGASALVFNAGGGTTYGTRATNLTSRNAPDYGYIFNACIDTVLVNANALGCTVGVAVFGAPQNIKLVSPRIVNCATGVLNYTSEDAVFIGNPTLSGNTTDFFDNGSGGSVREWEKKSSTGDYSTGNYQGRHVVNTSDSTFKVFSNSLWRTIANWASGLPVSSGGTGVVTLTGIPVGTGTAALSSISSSAANQYLRRNAANNGYEFAPKTEYINSTPTTGQTVSFNDNPIDQLLRINPAGDLAALTVDLPSNATSENTQKVIFMCTKNVAALTVTGATTIFNAPVSMNAGDCFQFYKSASNEWARVIT